MGEAGSGGGLSHMLVHLLIVRTLASPPLTPQSPHPASGASPGLSLLPPPQPYSQHATIILYQAALWFVRWQFVIQETSVHATLARQ